METEEINNDAQPLKSKNYKLITIICFFVICVLLVIFIVINSRFNLTGSRTETANKNLNASEQNLKTVKVAEDATLNLKNNSTQENKVEAIANLDVSFKDATSEFDKNYLLLEKAYALIINRSSDNSVSSKEGRRLLDTVYQNTKNNDKLGFLNERALFGFVFAFAETCFPTHITKYVSLDVRKKYFKVTGPELDKMSQDQVQIEIFTFFIKLVDDTSMFKKLQNDKGFNGYSAYIKAVYLDSNKDQMSKKDRDSLIASIKKDIVESNNGQYIDVSSTTMRSTMLTPMHLALADYVVKQAESNANDYSVLSKVYVQIMNLNADPMGKDIVGAWIKMYILGAMERTNTKESIINKEVADLDNILKNNPELIETVREYLNYGLTENGKWFDIKLDMFTLAKRNTALKNLLDTRIGLKNY